MRAAFLALFVLAPLPAAANTTGCGGNAFTFAEVVEARPGTRAAGPVMSVPDSLCADLVEDRKPAVGSLNLQIGDPYGPATRRRGTTGRDGTAR
ncbi:MAG TPA: hypothetical protein VF601_10120 [Beijerinckiaceae bacterium]|jgi:hypothetical protein